MRATLYVVPGSHPSRAARAMLELKGIPHRRVDLMPVLAKPMLRALRFPAATVPALRIDGRRIQGSREIARALDALRPEPPLHPADPAERAAVEAAELWGDQVLQPAVRRILWNALRRNRAALRAYAEGARLGIPIGVALRASAPIVALAARLNSAGDDRVRADLAALPSMLGRIDAWIAEGTIGRPGPNAADLQIASGIRLLMTLEDVAPAIAPRPAGELALRLLPDFPGRAPPVLPAPWLEPLRADAGEGPAAG